MNTKKRFLLVSLLVLAAWLCFALPIYAHGGEGEHLHGQATRWMLELIYIQLFMVPIIGIWLTKEVLDAWWSKQDPNDAGEN